MWLENFAWLWSPIAVGLALRMMWQWAALRAEVRTLRKRVEWLEAGMNAAGTRRSRAA